MERSASSMSFVLLTFTAETVAASLVYLRGASVLSIAKNTLFDPIGSLIPEIENITSEDHA